MRTLPMLALPAALLAGLAVAPGVPTASAQTGDVPTGGDIALEVNMAAQAAGGDAFDPARVGFTASVQDLAVDHDRFFALALPGEVVEIEVLERPDDDPFAFDAPGMADVIEGPRSVAFAAPSEPGAYPVTVTSPEGEAMAITVLVLVPAGEVRDGEIGGYEIGEYPDEPLRGLDTYLPPEGYIEMTPELRDLPLSPHFRLGQFVAKQGGSAQTAYLVVRPALVHKLERLLARVNEAGARADSLYVMSGYRTPHYNEQLGNVLYSRHQWGDAADVYVDFAPRDRNMDDVDGDGAVTRADASWLYDVADELDATVEMRGVRGGVGEYGANAAHGPFVHVDTRGTPARWGRK